MNTDASRRGGRATGAGAVDQSALQHLLGYHLVQADITARAAFARHIGTPLKLRPVEFTILLLAQRNAPITQKQLSQTLAISAPNMTILLDRLVERGWIERVRSQDDRRVQHVHLTAAGQAMATEAHAVSLQSEREMLRHLTAGEQAMLLELLDKVAGQRRA